MRTNWIAMLLLGAGVGSARWHESRERCIDTSILASEGDSVGTEEIVDGVTFYISAPKGDSIPKVGLVYLTDVFGIQLLQNRLLADSFARAGYLTVAPDLFNGTPASADIDVPTTASADFVAAHADVSDTDAIVAKAVAYLRDTVGVEKIGATGYCFGGRYAFRAAGVANATDGADAQTDGAAGPRVDAAFAAHPAMLENEEISSVAGPASVAAAEIDSMMSPERRSEIEGLLKQAGVPYQFSLYSGTSHGFGVRANMSDPQQRFGKETAFLQAVRWFDYWL